MGWFRKIPLVVAAHQWHRNGDHPLDETVAITAPNGLDYPSEGKVVRYYRDLQRDGNSTCERCSRTLHDHGWIETLEGGHIVCPGDWVITRHQGRAIPLQARHLRGHLRANRLRANRRTRHHHGRHRTPGHRRGGGSGPAMRAVRHPLTLCNNLSRGVDICTDGSTLRVLAMGPT